MATKEDLSLVVGALEKIYRNINYVATYAEQQAIEAVAEDYGQTALAPLINKAPEEKVS